MSLLQFIGGLGPFGFGLLSMTNPCVLPLYPGFLAYLAGHQSVIENRRVARWLGTITLAGLLVSMLLLGLLLSLLQIATGTALAILLPIAYVFVIGMGLLLFFHINPFERLPMIRSPRLKNPIVSSFLYGMLYGPMALPCNAGAVLAIFAFGVADARSVVSGTRDFLLFGLGFGLPLVILPLLADSVRQSMIRWLATHHRLFMRLAGLLLIAIGLISLANEWDSIREAFTPSPALVNSTSTPGP
ncbi:MAG TPA: cytochrome c biogenesis protein CcdA [Aggregatilineales bacterium]|nr:cytochrome c biogenesis protein CcdA [Aggregatilineales bacterium]